MANVQCSHAFGYYTESGDFVETDDCRHCDLPRYCNCRNRSIRESFKVELDIFGMCYSCAIAYAELILREAEKEKDAELVVMAKEDLATLRLYGSEEAA